MAMLIEGDRRDATMTAGHLMHVPGIKSGIGCQIGGKEAQCEHGLLVERMKMGDIVLIEALGVLGQHHIAILRHEGGRHPGAIAPNQLLFLLFLFLGGGFVFLGDRLCWRSWLSRCCGWLFVATGGCASFLLSRG